MIIRLKLKKSTDMYFTYYSCYNDNKPVVYLKPKDICFDSARINGIESVSPRKCLIDLQTDMQYDRYIIPVSMKKAVKILNGEVDWQSEDHTFIEVERVYATRIDCKPVPERVRQAA
jgi:hypothetical protein